MDFMKSKAFSSEHLDYSWQLIGIPKSFTTDQNNIPISDKYIFLYPSLEFESHDKLDKY